MTFPELSTLPQPQEQKTQQTEAGREKFHALFDRSRFFRHAKTKAIPRVSLTARDEAIFDILYFKRVATSTMIKKLIGHTGSDTAFNHRMNKLWRAEYVDKIPEGLYLRLTRQETDLLWAIGKEAYTVLAPKYDLPTDNYQARRQREKNDSLKASTLIHDVRLNRFWSCMELAARDHAEVRLAFWNRYGVKIEVKDVPAYLLKLFPYWVTRDDLVVIPDSHFALDNEGQATRRHFFVEYHHRSDCSPRWVYKKALGYAECWRQDLCSKERGFSKDDFAILLIAPTPARKDGMRRAIAKFLAEAWRKGAKYPEDLWLCTDDSFCLDEPHTVFDSIWQTATSEEKFSLLALE